ncbi:energy-coupling factor transport system permease protein [Desulfacinum hydrothermale DSM 13146]|uniref:Energy-coupling factor transport system permease protein n=1 Tax=Desulfacinum hydrothermale DSM 13146 TaxID=1121390 RepID=A0A1W1XTK6_9BACT|nr:energy-coupling factor transporter transmembrane component T [Desulfacinum hydrothermale]SMC27182.1 energy-coupling factor transport system permease protein [Desulfacinum hydrothermale DSM 13146]
MKGLDPRTRLLLGLVFTVTVLTTQTRPVLLMEAAALWSLLVVLRLVRSWSASLRLTLPMIALVFLVSILAFDAPTAVDLSVRLHNLFAASFVFFQVLTAEELAQALEAMRVPHVFVFMLTTALRYVPLMTQKIKNIRAAQTARGLDLRLRPRNIGHFTALVVPLLFQAFILADHLALAMESRGFSRRKGRTASRLGRFRLQDAGAALTALLLCALLLWWDQRGAV